MRSLSDHRVVLCKVRLVDAWIKRRELVIGARGIISEKLREHQYIEGYASCLECKRVEWKEDDNVKQIWEQVKRLMLDIAREAMAQ